MQLDTDAIIWSAPERERGGRPLLVLLHGYGSHEGDLFQLAPLLPLDLVVASVRAPLTQGAGYAWFPITRPGDPEREIVDGPASAVLSWLSGIEASSVALLGFSQGAAIALQALRHAPERFSAVVALSGFVAAGVAPGDAALVDTRPPVFWGRGSDDGVITPAAIERTAAWLPAHSSLTARVYEGVAHSITADEISEVSAFLRSH